jgi:beta-galactosidase
VQPLDILVENMWVNGHHLGRRWRLGPQRTLFCPGVWLQKGSNEIIVLDLEHGRVRSVAGITNPVWSNDEA